MKFQVGGREYILQGEKVPGYSLTSVSQGKLGRALNKAT